MTGGRAVVVVGALLAATLTGENNDTYLQVGLITTIGVSAKRGLLSGPPAICES
jgi:multidrug efflux pump subunit AcrB